MEKILFRWHRSTLEESMSTVVEIGSFDELKKIINEEYPKAFTRDIKIDYYGFDNRTGWDNYIVAVDNSPVGWLNNQLVSNEMKTNRIYLSGEILTDVDFSCFDGLIAWVKLETIDSFVDEAGEKYSTVQDHNLVAVGKIAEIFKNFLLKGMKIQVWGKLAYNSYKEGDRDLRYISIHVEKVKY